MSAQVLKCPSIVQAPKYLSAQVPFQYPSVSSTLVPKLPSALRVPKCLKCLSTLNAFSALGMALKCCLSARVPFECPSSTIWVTKCPLSALQKTSATSLEMDSLIVFRIYNMHNTYCFLLL